MTALDRRRSIVEEEKKLSDAGPEQVSEKALAVVARVESKLKGKDFVDEVVADGVEWEWAVRWCWMWSVKSSG